MSEIEKYSRKGSRSNFVSTIFGISLVLIMLGVMGMVLLSSQRIKEIAIEQLDMSFELNEQATEVEIKQFEKYLNEQEYTAEATYISPEQGLKELKEKMNDDSILEVIDGENPLLPKINIRIKSEYAFKDSIDNILARVDIKFPNFIQESDFKYEQLEEVNVNADKLLYILGFVSLLLLFVSIAMINNTIRLALYSKRFIIKTMQLVGATPRFIRQPFLLKSLLQGFMSALIAIGVMLVLQSLTVNIMPELEKLWSFAFFIQLFGAILILGLVISYLSTWIALNKYLKIKLDNLY